MNRLLSLLAVLALLVAGAGVCPAAHGLSADGDMAGTMAHAVADDTETPCHGETAGGEKTKPQPDAGPHPCCDGGAACGDCALLTVVLAEPAAEPGGPEPGQPRAFSPASAPDLIFVFDPPPPRTEHA